MNLMKRLLISLCAVALLGAGCLGFGPRESAFVPVFENGGVYTNSEFGFVLEYPSELEVRVRPDDVRESTYLGMDVDFFASLRDITRDDSSINIAYFFSIPELTLDEFTAALEASSENVEVVSVEDFQANDLSMKKIVSTTDIEIDKQHYLFEHGGTTILLSVFLEEEAVFDPIVATLQSYE